MDALFIAELAVQDDFVQASLLLDLRRQRCVSDDETDANSDVVGTAYLPHSIRLEFSDELRYSSCLLSGLLLVLDLFLELRRELEVGLQGSPALAQNIDKP